MKVSIFGLGYVGAVTAACLSRDGHSVVGVDVSEEKVDALNRGESPIVEHGVGAMLSDALAAGRLSATTHVRDAVLETDVSLIAVGTPSRSNGSVDLSALRRVCESLGDAVRSKESRHTIVVRSTVPAGTVRNEVLPLMAKTVGKSVGDAFGVCFNPEFLREGCAVKDFYSPPFTLVGCDDDRDFETIKTLYAAVDAEFFVTSLETAEMVKYVCNTFHALKITFANEVGTLSRELGVDAHEVMSLVCKDTKLNISPAYMRPGFAFGGSCLPKDVRALGNLARAHEIDLPLLRSLLQSNEVQIRRAIDVVLKAGKRKVSVLGLSFKEGTDDLRESPVVGLVETLIGKGFDVQIFDQNVAVPRLIGQNRAYIDKEIPHIASLMRDDLSAVVDRGEVIVIGNRDDSLDGIASLIHSGQIVVDLAYAPALASLPGVAYHGVAW